jgi:hypothetical protein
MVLSDARHVAISLVRFRIQSGRMTRRSARDSSGIVELRQFTARPGKRDALIALFDDRFVEP